MKKTTSNLSIFIFHWVKHQRYDTKVNEWNMLFWSLQKICSFLWISLSSVTIMVAVLFLNSLSTLTQRTANENAAGIFLWDRFCLSAVSLSRQRHDIVDFSCCPLWRVLRVILVNLQNFGFEFHLRSLPSAFSGYGWSVDELITSALTTPCWRDSTRSKQPSTVATLGLQIGLYHVIVPLSFLRTSALHHCFLLLNVQYSGLCA